MVENPLNSWQAVRDEVLRRVQTHVWPPGDLLPTEAELAAEFGCARTTVNRALRALAETGLLDRRRKAGTRVSLNPGRRATLEIPIIRQDVVARGQRYTHSLLSMERRRPPADIRARMQLQGTGGQLHVKTLHMANGQAYAYEDRWVSPQAVPNVTKVDFDEISINEWLVKNVIFTRGDVSFSAKNATADEAEVFGADVGTALFVLERTTWRDDTAITTVRFCFAPGHRMHTEI